MDYVRYPDTDLLANLAQFLLNASSKKPGHSNCHHQKARGALQLPHRG
jgi:hypothetical protein